MYSKDNPDSIKKMFDNIADNYDFVNNLISFGMHKSIRDDAIKQLSNKSYSRVIDLCTGTGDIAFLLKKKFPESSILAVDFSSKMLEIAKNKMKQKSNSRGKNNITFEIADVMELPYDHNVFDLATMFFGLRNLPDVDRAIEGIYKILKPNAEFLILDIVKRDENNFLVYDYFKKYMPKLASVFTRDKEAYKYLSQSMENFPTHDELIMKMQKHKFEIIKSKTYLNGIISLNLGKKFV